MGGICQLVTRPGRSHELPLGSWADRLNRQQPAIDFANRLQDDGVFKIAKCRVASPRERDGPAMPLLRGQ
jgi:hypothetical protein